MLLAVFCVVATVAAVEYFSNSADEAQNNTSEAASLTGSAVKNENDISQSGAGFPLSFSSNDIVDVKAVGSYVYVLSNEVLFCISPSGKLVFHRVINFSEPVMKTNGNYGVVFDRLSGKYLLLSKQKVIFSGQTQDEAQIVTAQVSSNGSYALVSRGEDAASILTFYSKKGEARFAWACSKEHIVSVAIASNGRDLACAALSAQDGEIVTKLYRLDIYSDETQWEYTVKGSAAIELSFASTNRLSLLCNNTRLLIDSKNSTELSRNDYPTDLIHSYTDSNGYSVTLTTEFGSFGGYEIKNYSPSNSVNYTFNTDSKVISVFCSGKKSYLLTETEIICVNTFGSESRRIELEASGLGLCFAGGKLYYYSLNRLYKN